MIAPFKENSTERYFVDLCSKIFSDDLLWIINTDSYIRQPCYSSRARDYYYLIFKNNDQKNLGKLKYIQGEFPEFFLNYLTEKELKLYPSHGKWQFCFSPIVYSHNETVLPVFTKKSDNISAISQAIIGVGHIARLYFLSDHNDKSHVWAVRQLGWAFRYAENGILKLWNYLTKEEYSSDLHIPEIKEKTDWLLAVNKNWEIFEKTYLSSIQEYKAASLKLNGIVQFFSKILAETLPDDTNYIISILDNYDHNKFSFISSLRDELAIEFKEDLKCFYLNGSAARGDQHKNSDIDSIGVFSNLDDVTMQKLREIKSKQTNISIYSLSINDLKIYPKFRYYTLNEGTKKILGNISFKETIDNESMFYGIANNIFTIIQIARSYLLAGNYGPRAHYMLKLMLKLADHGCLRLLYKYIKGAYPDRKEDVKEFFSGSPITLNIMDFLLNINEEEEDIKTSLLNDNQTPLIEKYLILNSFGEEFYQKVEKIKGAY